MSHPKIDVKTQAAPVLLYDGICGVCNSAVQTILRLDPHGSLRFAALDSDFARGVIDRHPFLAGVDSVVFVERPGQFDEEVAVKSDARSVSPATSVARGGCCGCQVSSLPPCGTLSTTASRGCATGSSALTTRAPFRHRKSARGSWTDLLRIPLRPCDGAVVYYDTAAFPPA